MAEESHLEDIAYAENAARDIVLDELMKQGISCEVTAEIPDNIWRVGVFGDDRVYGRNVMLGLYKDGQVFYNPKIIGKISSRLTNEMPREPFQITGVTLEIARKINS